MTEAYQNYNTKNKNLILDYITFYRFHNIFLPFHNIIYNTSSVMFFLKSSTLLYSENYYKISYHIIFFHLDN